MNAVNPLRADAAPLLRLQDVSLAWEGEPVVHGLTGDIARGELLAVVGPNGAGKSSLLLGLTGQLRPRTGRIVWQGLRPEEVVHLPQSSGVDRTLPLSVSDFLSLGLWPRTGAWARANLPADDAAIDHVLHRVGLQAQRSNALAALSVGQFRRVLFARAWLRDAPVLLLDEPFNALDEPTTDALMDVLHRWHDEGRTVIVVLHDLARVRRHLPRTLLLAGGPVAWGPTEQVLTPRHLEAAAHWKAPWVQAAGASDRMHESEAA